MEQKVGDEEVRKDRSILLMINEPLASAIRDVAAIMRSDAENTSLTTEVKLMFENSAEFVSHGIGMVLSICKMGGVFPPSCQQLAEMIRKQIGEEGDIKKISLSRLGVIEEVKLQ